MYPRMRVALPGGDHRTDVGRRVQRITDLHRADEVGEAVLHRVDLPARDNKPGQRRTRLTVVDEPAAHGDRQGGCEVAVVQQHERGFAAEFQRDPLDGASGRLGDADPGLRRPGDADHVDLGMPGEQVADLPSGPTDDVDGAWRQAELVDDLGQVESRKRGRTGRLEDRRATSGQRGRQLRGKLVQRVVPRGNRRDDPGRLPDQQGGSYPLFEGELLEDVGDRPEHVDRQADLDAARCGDRRPYFAAHQVGELFFAGGQAVGDRPQRRHPVGNRTRGPSRKRRPGGGDCFFDLSGGASGHAAHRLFGAAVDDRDIAARLRGRPAPTDIELFADLHGNLPACAEHK